jgi:16S rRNA (guanine966-N2)-methyltransferase
VASHAARAKTLSKAKNGGTRRTAPRLPKRANDAGSGARESRARTRVLRIIGGRHRGRRLQFPGGVDIRPTPDRVRETLFNWLQPRLANARVLDLFAGSGALGLEALSRGAAHTTFVERDRLAAAAIRRCAEEWGEVSANVVCADALAWLKQETPDKAPFDIVFLDPPYDSPLLVSAASALARSGKLAPDARVYVERRARDPLPALPDTWKELRAGRAGEVGYHLFAI